MSKILVVEDSRTQREMIANLLKANQFEITTAKNGLEAIAKAESFQPDLVILDIIMPGMNGFELCRKLRDNPATWNISIMFCSAKSTLVDRHWGYKQGANAHIGKPFAESELIETVREILISN